MDWIVLFPIAWTVGWIGASVVYRLTRGKPILFFGVRNAKFQERRASGHSKSSWFTRFGGAENCMVVAVTNNHVVIRPWFPFTLMFLPEIYDLEHELPHQNLVDAKVCHTWLRTRIDLEFRDSSGQTKTVGLYLRDPDGFLSMLPVEVTRSLQSHRPTRK